MFKYTANEQTKNQIRDHLVHMITSFKPNMFKKLPGINNAEALSISGLEILPFVANFGFLSASETQGLRRVCKSFNERDILDQTRAFSLEDIEQILQD